MKVSTPEPEPARQKWDLQALNWNTTQNDNAWNRIFGVYGNYDPETERYQKKKLRAEAEAAESANSGGGLLSIGKSVLSRLGAVAGLALFFALRFEYIYLQI